MTMARLNVIANVLHTFLLLSSATVNLRFPNRRQSLPGIRIGFVHNYSMARARILGNDCPRFGKLLQLVYI